MSKLIERVRERWQREGILNRPAAEAEVAEFEQKYGVSLCGAVRQYFTTLNGTRDGRLGMDDADQIGFWHLDEVVTLSAYNETSDPETADLFVFADWLINSWAYAVRLSGRKDERSPVFVTYDPPKQVADSFEEFLERYADRDLTMLFPE